MRILRFSKNWQGKYKLFFICWKTTHLFPKEITRTAQTYRRENQSACPACCALLSRRARLPWHAQKMCAVTVVGTVLKLNYGLEETDGKLLLTPLQGNYWNQNLHGLHMKRYIQESLSVVFFFFRVLFKKMENVICCVYMPWCKHEIRVLGEFKTIVTNCKPQKNSFLLRCFYSGNFPRKSCYLALCLWRWWKEQFLLVAKCCFYTKFCTCNQHVFVLHL